MCHFGWSRISPSEEWNFKKAFSSIARIKSFQLREKRDQHLTQMTDKITLSASLVTQWNPIYELMRSCGEIIFPIRTRWRPLRDWARNASESKFYNEIFPHPASTFSKEQNAFPHFRCERSELSPMRKNVNNRSAQEMEALGWKRCCCSLGKRSAIEMKIRFLGEGEIERDQERRRQRTENKFSLHNAQGENGIIMSFFLLKSSKQAFEAQLRVAVLNRYDRNGEKKNSKWKFYFRNCGGNSINKASSNAGKQSCSTVSLRSETNVWFVVTLRAYVWSLWRRFVIWPLNEKPCIDAS